MTPKIRQTLYSVGTIATALLSLLALWNVVDPNTASTVNAGLAGLLSLLGVGAAGTAAVITRKQRHDGTFDAPPDPAEAVVNGIEAVLKAKQEAEAQVDRVRDAVSNAVRDVPVLGPLAQEALDRLR